MDKFLTKRPRVEIGSTSSSVGHDSQGFEEDPIVEDNSDQVVEFDDNELVSDPGSRKSIDSFDVNIRDRIRRAYVAKGPCQPKGHDYPKTAYGKDSRSFRDAWFDKYNWLEYSKSKDAAYCFWCFLFKRESTSPGDDAFTVDGVSNWKKALEKFRGHVGEVNSAHQKARGAYVDFLNQKQSVTYLVGRASTKQEVEYRIRLTASLDVARFLLKQGLSFRGHDESLSSKNMGNFKELLDWYGKRNEEVGKVVMENAPKNHQMTAPSIQKELANACAVETILDIMSDLGDGLFSIMVDEARDCSVKEQMSLVIRYVNKPGEIIERFIAIAHVKETTSVCLKSEIDSIFSKLGLSISRLRGQGYDGASNMRGEFNGLKALIQKENPSAFYVHCFAHQLQLVCVAVCKTNQYVKDFFCYLGSIVTVCGSSCKRADNLRQLQHDKIVELLEAGEITSGQGKHQETSLRRACDTRWGSHFNTLNRLDSLWPSVQQVLENILADGGQLDGIATVRGLLNTMESYEFVFVMKLMRRLLGIIHPLSSILQEQDQNILNAIHQIGVVKQMLQQFRDSSWDNFLHEVEIFCQRYEIHVPTMDDIVPRRSRIKRDGTNTTYYHHYRVEIFCQVVDLIMEEMGDRFSESTTDLLACMTCLDPRDKFGNFNVDKLVHLATFYQEDFSSIERMVLAQELENFIVDVRSDSRYFDIEDLASLSKIMVSTRKVVGFPLVYRLIKLVLLLPVSTASVERSFSAMKFVKGVLRNRMGDDWLNDNLICYIEKDIFENVSNDRILERFQKMSTRKSQLS